jgi:carboxyl-terminal processing protease
MSLVALQLDREAIVFSKLRTSLTLLIGALLGIGLTLAFSAWASRNVPSLPWQQANLFAEVYERVRRDYIEEIPDEQLMTNAVRGVMSGLDQYSTYLDAREYAEMRMSTSGAYSGVGIEVSLTEGAMKVMAVIDDSPAARAGIHARDVIVAIDTIPVDPAKLNDAVDRLRGKPGAHVALSIRRADAPQLLKFDLVRRKVQVHSVKSEVLESGYAYVRISQFSETTADDFSATLKTLQSGTPLRGLVLDLRNNPGGVLEAAVAIADEFLDSGIIVTAQGRAVGADFTMQAHPGDVLNGAPMMVLVNGGSASASEILAGALQDNHRAQLIGQTTYGKGLVQTITSLDEGGALKLTTSRYHTPSGASIQQKGITPDIPLTGSDTSRLDNQGNNALSGLLVDSEVRAALDKLKSQTRNANQP